MNPSTPPTYRIGIVIAADFLKHGLFGGAYGLIENIVHKFSVPVEIFGISLERHALWRRTSMGPSVAFTPIAGISYPSRIPMRFKCLVAYILNRGKILRSGVDLLYVHSPELALPFVVGNRSIPVVFHQHGSGNPLERAKFVWARNRPFKRLFDRILRIVHRGAAWNIVIDRFCLEQAALNGVGQKTTMLMNAVDGDKFFVDSEARRACREEMGIGNGEYVIFFAGRLEEIKRVGLILAAFPHIIKDGGQFRVVIAGEGTLRTSLEREVVANGLSNFVVFLGRVEHDRLRALYNAADLLVLPSEMEGVPMVILEALACGTPVLATRVGGIPDIVRVGENGCLLDDASPQGLSKAVRAMRGAVYDRPSVADSVTRLMTDAFVRSLEDIFECLVARKLIA